MPEPVVASPPPDRSEQRSAPVRFITHSPARLPAPGNVRDAGITGYGHVVRPRGDIRLRGAVVICPGLGGPTQLREFAYARRLAAQGYVALVIDPYATRNAAWLPDPLRPLRVGPAMMLADSFAGLRWLRTQRDFGHDLPVTLLGFSYGGMVSLLAAHEQVAGGFAAGTERFDGHAAYYGCSIPRMEDVTATGAPVLMLFGECDRNVSLPRVELMADDLRRGGALVDLHILPGAWHAWDGWDERRRWVMFSLRDCEVLVGRDGIMREEATGRPLADHRALVRFLARRARIAGYHMQRDPELAKATDACLLAFLDSIGEASRRAAIRAA
jgi:dienelactone hydrolase